MSESRQQSFFEFSADLIARATADPNALGLVLVGSAADIARVDEWSDHDFFLVVKPGLGELYRTNLDWLPKSEEIAFKARETAHGLKVVYTDGHVLEFAVFEDQELELATVNYWTVPVDKSDITFRVEKLEVSNPVVPSESDEWGLFLALILIAVGRARRGEYLVAGQAIRSYYMKHVLNFVRRRVPPKPETEYLQDSLDTFRRFERQYPEQAAEIEANLRLPVEESARSQLEFVLSLGGFSEEQLSQAKVVRDRLGW